MQEAVRKIKRVQPILKTKQAKVNQEASVLNEIRTKKIDVVTSMKEYQRKYMEGVEQLNTERCSASRDMLGSLEDSLDFVKSKWYTLYKEVQELEKMEHAQRSILIDAQIALKAVEKLETKYEDNLKHEIKITDQKEMDEIALRKYAERS